MRTLPLLLATVAHAALGVGCITLDVTQTMTGSGGGAVSTAVSAGTGGSSADGGAAAEAGAGGGGVGGFGGGGGSAAAGGEGGAAGGAGGEGGAPVPTCGDGVIAGAEECDGSPFPTNCQPPGHPSECTLKPPVVTDLTVCPGADVDIDLGQSLVLGPYDNSTGVDDMIGSCLNSNTGGRDHVFHFHAMATGTLTIMVGNDPDTGSQWCDSCVGTECDDGGVCWVGVLYARSGACDGPAAIEVACVWDPTFVSLAPTLTIPVQQFEHYWVVVDSYWDGVYTAGTYYLEAALTPSS